MLQFLFLSVHTCCVLSVHCYALPTCCHSVSCLPHPIELYFMLSNFYVAGSAIRKYHLHLKLQPAAACKLHDSFPKSICAELEGLGGT